MMVLGHRRILKRVYPKSIVGRFLGPVDREHILWFITGDGINPRLIVRHCGPADAPGPLDSANRMRRDISISLCLDMYTCCE